MRVLGLTFAGTATDKREEMTAFLTDLLGLDRADLSGASADFFVLPDGSRFAVAGPRELGETSRTIGFLVESVDEALRELRAAGVWTDDAVDNEAYRYAHFRAPDGALYELVERR